MLRDIFRKKCSCFIAVSKLGFHCRVEYQSNPSGATVSQLTSTH